MQTDCFVCTEVQSANGDEEAGIVRYFVHVKPNIAAFRLLIDKAMFTVRFPDQGTEEINYENAREIALVMALAIIGDTGLSTD